MKDFSINNRGRQMIKLIAVDMDGTFLNSEGRYNRARFMELYTRMKEQGIKFVVASGNQYAQLRSFFEPIHEEISFVSENGSLVIHQNEEVSCAEISKEDVQLIHKYLEQHPDISYIVTGKDSAYILEKDEEHYPLLIEHYHKLQRVQSFDEVTDDLFSFALILPEEMIPQIKEDMDDMIGHIVAVKHCGFGAIDLNPIGINKAEGIKQIQEKYGISAAECMAFGDSGNDLEMLTHVGRGYAMENASDVIKDATDLRAPHHNDEGVLEVIESYLDSIEE